jgi:ER-bound oxygenase mpaB/B'/Rubber oxygenase, catalytic domain
MVTSNAWTWSDRELDAARKVGDPEADSLFSLLHESHGAESWSALTSRVWGGPSIPQDLAPPLLTFLDMSAKLPHWANEDKINRAQRLYDRYAADLLAMLLYAALPQCYAAADGTQVLLHTKRLADSPRSRLTTTARFVVDVMSPGSLAPNGRGVRSGQTLRLVHAAVRRHIFDSGSWDSSNGVPINQEDMAGTLVAFSQVSLDALIKMGARISGADQDAYVHAWSVIGHLMGIRRGLLCDSIGEARVLSQLVRRRHHRESEAGRRLTGELLAFAGSRFPHPLKGMPAALVRYLISDETADLLGIPSSNRTRHLVALLRAGFWSRDVVSQLIPPVRVIDFYNRLPFVKAVLWVESRNGRARILTPQRER